MQIAAAVLASVTLVASTSAAQADDAREQSRAAFRRGVALIKEGNYAGARDAFADAYKLFAHPSILLNLGIARSKTGEWVDAEADLVRFLADDGGATPEEVQSARTALAEVREHIGTLKLKVAPDAARATLDGKPVALTPGDYSEVRATVGAHDLHIEADGYEPFDEKVGIGKGKDTVKQVALFAGARASGGAHVGGGVGGGSGSGLFTPDTRHVVGWSLVGVGVLAAGFGTFSGLRAISLSSDYKTTHDASTKSSGVLFRTLADVSFLGAIVTAGIGGYLLFWPQRSSATASTSTQLVVGVGYAGVAGTFRSF